MAEHGNRTLQHLVKMLGYVSSNSLAEGYPIVLGIQANTLSQI